MIRGFEFALLAVASTGVNAAFLTIDPSHFVAGTDISNAVAGATLSNISGGYPPNTPLTTSAVYATECTVCDDELNGQLVFGHGPLAFDTSPQSFDFADFAARYFEEDYSSTYHFVAGRWNALRVDFSAPTSSVQILGGGARNGNFFLMDLWDSSGQRIGRCSSSFLDPNCAPIALGSGEADPSKSTWSFTFNSSAPNIAFITTGGWGGGQYVHSVSFEVPEPSTLALFGLGFVALLLCRGRQMGPLKNRLL